MKTKVLSLVSMFLIGAMTVFAQSKTEEFKVFGNCGMCESRIEKAALSVDGVTEADWNKETKMMKLAFDETKTDVHKVHMTIAKVGHDTEMHKAKDEVYAELPGCCKYDRDETDEKKKGHEGHNH